jgi:hypothetical protein
MISLQGLSVSILRDESYPDGSGYGLSHYFNQALLVEPKIAPLFEATTFCPIVEERHSKSHDMPLIRIVNRVLPNGTSSPYAVPYLASDRAMMGGCFIWTSDSRFRQRYPHPIPLHDRFEQVCSIDNWRFKNL